MTGRPLDDSRLPERLSEDALTVFAAGFPPEDGGVVYRLLRRQLDDDDGVVLVTANTPPTTVVDNWRRADGNRDRQLAVVDTTAGQSFENSYRDVPVVGTPAVGDLARTSIGVSDLAGDLQADGNVHLVVPTLGPFLAEVDAGTLSRMLVGFAESPTIDGVALVGADYTDHPSADLDECLHAAAAVVWGERKPSGEISLRFQRRRHRMQTP